MNTSIRKTVLRIDSLKTIPEKSVKTPLFDTTPAAEVSSRFAYRQVKGVSLPCSRLRRKAAALDGMLSTHDPSGTARSARLTQPGSAGSLLPPSAEGGFTQRRVIMRSTLLVPLAPLDLPNQGRRVACGSFMQAWVAEATPGLTSNCLVAYYAQPRSCVLCQTTL